MYPASVLIAVVLEIKFFGHTYPVEITSLLDITGTIEILKDTEAGNWHERMWGTFTLARQEDGNPWSENK